MKMKNTIMVTVLFRQKIEDVYHYEIVYVEKMQSVVIGTIFVNCRTMNIEFSFDQVIEKIIGDGIRERSISIARKITKNLEKNIFTNESE